MAFQLLPEPGDPGEPQVRLGRTDGALAGAERRVVRDGVQVRAHGALLCPECDLPIAAAGRLPVGLEVRCGFCDHTGPAREFLAEDVFDTLANEVYLVARFA